MADRTRIPRSIDDFNPYIINTNAYLLAGTPTNAERLGILPAETDKWTGFLNEWTPLYLKYSDKKNGRTTAVKDRLLFVIEQCVDLDQTSHILDRIAASAAVSIVDMGTFNIHKGVLQKPNRSIPVTPISEKVAAVIQPIGGGTIAIKCHNSTSRASILDGADSVQFVYLVGDVPPTSAEAPGLMKDISTRAAFNLALGAENATKHLSIFFRWYNTRHPELAGPWSAMQSTLIL